MEELGLFAVTMGIVTALTSLAQIVAPLITSLLVGWRTAHREDTVREITLQVEGRTYKIDFESLAEQGPLKIDEALAAVRQGVREAA